MSTGLLFQPFKFTPDEMVQVEGSNHWWGIESKIENFWTVHHITLQRQMILQIQGAYTCVTINCSLSDCLKHYL